MEVLILATLPNPYADLLHEVQKRGYFLAIGLYLISRYLAISMQQHKRIRSKGSGAEREDGHVTDLAAMETATNGHMTRAQKKLK